MGKKTCVQSTNVVCTSLEEFGWMFVGSWISHTEEHVNTSQWRKQAPIHWLWKTLLLLWMWSEVTERNVCVHVRACICVWIRIVKWLRIVPTKGRLCDRVKRLVTGQDFCFRHECLCMHSFLPIWASSLRCKSTEIHKNTWNRLDDIKALSGQGVGQIVLRCGGHLRRARKQG